MKVCCHTEKTENGIIFQFPSKAVKQKMLDLFELARVTAKANAASPVAYSFGDNKFSYAELNDTLRNELNEYLNSHGNYLTALLINIIKTIN